MKTPKLSLKVAPRKALLRGLATDFVIHGKVEATEARVKALRPVVEKYITLSKQDNYSNKQTLNKYFYDEKAVKKLLKEIGPKYQERPGGYTRIIKLGRRSGDNAPMALLELV